MSRKVRQLRADLQKAGAYLTSPIGAHEVWKHQLIPSKSVVLPHHDEDANPSLERDVRSFLQQIAEAEQRQKQ